MVSRRLADDPHWALIAFLAICALGLRLIGLGTESLAHPEIYIPGIDLVPGISEPPPRHDWRFALWWHYHDEPHPIGWYMAMFGWTSVFGTTEFALRLPAAILGAASVALIYLVGRTAFGPRVALLAAVLLTAHGFHIFWSQNARMYTAGVFLGLLSIWFLFRLAQASRKRPALEVGYLLTCLAGIQTVEFFWPFLLMQIAWVGVAVAPPAPVGAGALLRPHRQGHRLLQLQGVTLAMGAPAILHAAYRARQGAAQEPSLTFMTDYLSFGFLMTLDDFPLPFLQLPGVVYWPILAFALVLLLAALRPNQAELPIWERARAGRPPSLPRWIAPLAAVMVAGFMLWLAAIATRRNAALTALAILPILALWVPVLGQILRNTLARLGPLARWVETCHPAALMIWFLGLVAPLVLFAASFVVEVLAERAFLIFVPSLLILTAAGAGRVVPEGLPRVAILSVLVAIFLGSVAYNDRRLVSPNDYKGLARAMAPHVEPGDMIFVRMRDWVDTPFFYYMKEGRYVAENHADALAEHPDARVWLVTWPYADEPVIHDARRTALAGYEAGMVLTALRASAELFVRPSP